MVESFLQNAEKIINTNPWLAFVVVFIGGLLTASNPCVLAMIPLMIGFVGGTKEITGIKRALLFSLFFVLGLSLAFSVLGVLAGVTGRLLGDVGTFWRYIVVVVCLVMGIYLLEIIRIPLPRLISVTRSYAVSRAPSLWDCSLVSSRHPARSRSLP